ncbi:MAG: MCE family protein [Gemmatimonadota bacterium]|nr:MAG: MCE family protein [Gemmatimonadota bacterium]
MKGKKTELIVGVFCLCAIIILIAGILFLKEFKFNRHRYSVTVLFDNASGLKEGDPVMVAGVRKGSVKSIALRQGKVQVDVFLESDVHLSDDSKFMIMSSGFVGMKYVEIDPGESGHPLDPSQVVEGVHQTDLFEVVGMLGTLVTEVRQLVGKIDRSIGGSGILGSIEQTLTDAQVLMKSIRSLVDENRPGFNDAVRDFKTTSQELKNLVGDNRTVIDSTIMQFSSSAERFDTVLLRLEEISSTFKIISDRIDQGEGTLGELVNSRELYDKLQRTTEEINLLIEDIKKNPNKYFKISVFDF